jgi:hypothetical protein
MDRWLRAAATQGAGAAEGFLVDDRDARPVLRTRIAATIAAVPVPMTRRSKSRARF